MKALPVHIIITWLRPVLNLNKLEEKRHTPRNNNKIVFLLQTMGTRSQVEQHFSTKRKIIVSLYPAKTLLESKANGRVSQKAARTCRPALQETAYKSAQKKMVTM